MKSILTLSVLFVAQAAAKIGMGLCPLPSSMTFAQYQTAYPVGSAPYNRKYVWADKGFHDLFVGFLKTFLPNIPDFKCGERFP